jgi:CheY-like chemotaxis protein
MGDRVFVKVVGFTDVERHALNTVFRLSDERAATYVLWTPDAPEPPRLALVDGQAPEGREVLESPGTDPDLKLIWVGAITPARAVRSFVRPLAWPDVVQAMDELFAPPPAVDFDLDLDPVTPSAASTAKRVLVTGAEPSDRFYLRAKLASVGLLDVDEAESATQLQELTQVTRYQAILLDLDLPAVDGWALLRQLTSLSPPVAVIVFKQSPGFGTRLRARFAGAQACLGKPPHPGRLQSLLQNI